MRAVVQRVRCASVRVDDTEVGTIEGGLLVYLGIGADDDDSHVQRMVDKVAHLRVFEDDTGRMARSVLDVGGSVLVVSQFTLFGDLRKGRRPSFEGAAEPGRAEPLYEAYCSALRATGVRVATGRFRSMMQVRCEVDGPITILIDTHKTF